MRFRCHRCRREWPFDVTRYSCPCGGVLAIIAGPTFDPARVREDTHNLWRYREALPLPSSASPVTLGEGWTPLIAVDWGEHPIHFKVESINPTGSFKDRGAALLVSALRAAAVSEVVEDSSGNAGAALSAYAARSNLDATVYVPAHASPAKQAQIAVYGAKVVAVPGSRGDTARAVLHAVKQGAAYASHAYSPLYAHGMKTVAYELWEQSDGCAPDSVMMPLGHGGLLLGLHVGFGELLAAGLIERRPRLFGIQAEACAPLARAWQKGEKEVEPVEEGDTVAGGVRIAAPPWGEQVLDAVRRSEGAIFTVSDRAAISAQKKLARLGFYVEPTSALAVAALDLARDRQTFELGDLTVVVLTGSGLKTPSAGA